MGCRALEREGCEALRLQSPALGGEGGPPPRDPVVRRRNRTRRAGRAAGSYRIAHPVRHGDHHRVGRGGSPRRSHRVRYRSCALRPSSGEGRPDAEPGAAHDVESRPRRGVAGQHDALGVGSPHRFGDRVLCSAGSVAGRHLPHDARAGPDPGTGRAGRLAQRRDHRRARKFEGRRGRPGATRRLLRRVARPAYHRGPWNLHPRADRDRWRPKRVRRRARAVAAGQHGGDRAPSAGSLDTSCGRGSAPRAGAVASDGGVARAAGGS